MSEQNSKSNVVSRIKSNTWCQEKFDMSNSRFLGKGTFGEVVSVHDLKTKKEMALKCMKVSDAQEFKTAIDEIVKMSSLSHPNIIKIYDYFPEAIAEQNGEIEYTILMAIELGFSSMEDYLKKNIALSDEQLTKVSEALGSSLAYAHDRKIVHCDLKPANILIVEDGGKESWTAKISDWGGGYMFLESKANAATSYKQGMAFTLIYSAPEISKHMGDIPENIKIDYMLADVYSLGLILLNCCGKPKSDTKNLSLLCLNEKEHDKEVEKFLDELRKESVYSSRTLDVIQSMLRYEPKRRKEFYDKLSQEKDINIEMKKGQALAAQEIIMNPETFADAAKTFIEAQGKAIENVKKAIDSLRNARSFIAETITDRGVIVNVSSYECTWHTYNDVSPIKITTQFQSYMGAYCSVSVHCLGWGAMSCYKNNKSPAYLVQRGKVYVFDGKNLSMFMSK